MTLGAVLNIWKRYEDNDGSNDEGNNSKAYLHLFPFGFVSFGICLSCLFFAHMLTNLMLLRHYLLISRVFSQ